VGDGVGGPGVGLGVGGCVMKRGGAEVVGSWVGLGVGGVGAETAVRGVGEEVTTSPCKGEAQPARLMAWQQIE
jgi:hypothetical protein